ncbi:hypothetical protein MKI84_11450 [Ancylobacter sp. A5.8]|uniref:hypothetical protein n=1 Tax=Ancylobacter gelatini TaxID=2919920 RepID=UPI001F4E64EC|nr:hypothetical protein [Ancylobacter gelatini]MCJ8143530.1 hypothetical protein [Ancylobacter gelatini]
MAEPDAQNDFAKLSEDLAVLRADVAKLAETLSLMAKAEGEAVTDAVRQKVRAGAARAEATASGLLEEGTAAYEEAKARAQGLTSELGSTIERNPLSAVAAALGIGFLFGLLTRGRN